MVAGTLIPVIQALAVVDALCLVGAGAYAFVKVKSKPSIIASSGMGICLLAGCYKPALPIVFFSFSALLVTGKKAFSSAPPAEKMVSLLGSEEAEQVAATSKKLFQGMFVLSAALFVLCIVNVM
eukprot:TRINITY_DN40911_c0_g1_i1.p2 TRINITY_DN40911_c0_g1~~TRINITY_DN40911_c0_g1_i1.p2  ORF type:complete len:144 (-),score=32.15 TRINITY_DN40911_c0_g1_i1:79-450(-)